MQERINSILEIVKAVSNKDSINLADMSCPIEKGGVNLHWWKQSGDVQNVGDRLSPVVVEYVCSLFNQPPRKQSRTRHLYAIGSIIDGGYQDATVWGSGLLRGKNQYWWRHFRKLDIRCVRGPETRRVLMNNGYICPEVYGDPAVLMPLIYKARDSANKTEYRVVPHMIYGSNYPNFLNPNTNDWQDFIDKIVQSKLVISSSLHGIILAEAYGVPAILLNDHGMNLYKYQDYYYSTGRTEFPIAKSVEEALFMQPAPIPDFSQMQKNLLDSFPSDLWG